MALNRLQPSVAKKVYSLSLPRRTTVQLCLVSGLGLDLISGTVSTGRRVARYSFKMAIPAS